MFNRTTIHQAPDHIRAEITVTEKRAPTDDSVRLLREMELEGFICKAGLQSPQIVDPIYKTRGTDPGIPGYDWARHETS